MNWKAARVGELLSNSNQQAGEAHVCTPQQRLISSIEWGKNERRSLMLQSHLEDHRLPGLKLAPVLVVDRNEGFTLLLVLA